MKTQIALFSLILLSLGGSEYTNNYNLQTPIANQANYKPIKTNVLPNNDKTNSIVKSQNLWKNIKAKDTVKEKENYKILKSNPALKYSIRKIGQGNRVIFSVNNGLRKLPDLIYNQSSGIYTETNRNKQGFDNVIFPFKCSLSTSVNFNENPFNNIGELLNDFEIEINEPGLWEVSFRN
ncbi:hypothetical protein [Cellulophaga lytica]|uniref:hypothetical protein n=1 Tax=Cellulophaga lytica TaxID=979 RepID=UPI003CE516B6